MWNIDKTNPFLRFLSKDAYCNFENNYPKVIYSIEQPNSLVTFDQSD